VSSELFVAGFEFHGHPERVEIDLTDARLWDVTAVAALDKVVFRYRRQGADVEVLGLDDTGQALVARRGDHDKRHLPQGVAH
jgi:SulP family sulfate permease